MRARGARRAAEHWEHQHTWARLRAVWELARARGVPVRLAVGAEVWELTASGELLSRAHE